jgi:hypothetical protein
LKVSQAAKQLNDSLYGSSSLRTILIVGSKREVMMVVVVVGIVSRLFLMRPHEMN